MDYKSKDLVTTEEDTHQSAKDDDNNSFYNSVNDSKRSKSVIKKNTKKETSIFYTTNYLSNQMQKPSPYNFSLMRKVKGLIEFDRSVKRLELFP